MSNATTAPKTQLTKSWTTSDTTYSTLRNVKRKELLLVHILLLILGVTNEKKALAVYDIINL